jgi:general secretion pathway protein G
MIKWALALAAAALLVACSDEGIDTAKQLLEGRLLDARDIKYRNVQAFPGDVVCGEFSTMDPLGSGRPFRPFIVRGERPDARPSKDDWLIFCSDDSAAALQSRLGMGPVGKPGSPLEKIHTDISALNQALDEYLADNFFLPSTPQGLATLTPAGKKPSPQQMNFREGGYISVLPQDPWGRPYRYERSGMGGTAQTCRVYTLGADGVEGGEGDNADVSSAHLKYLDHILR